MKIHHIDNLWVNPVASKEETVDRQHKVDISVTKQSYT